ncbi:hypothetical protein [Amycolatopsis sp. NPDC051372]|uniref:hypothetical protein n=1 Tax=Amycolatopsis sp. NPDC051372 TaxID=3155669 RepID=UPI0034293475
MKATTLFRGDRGSISVLILSLSAALIIGIGIAVDGARKAQAYSDATAVAEEAARAGGQALDVADLAAGQDAAVVPAQAVAAAQAYLEAADVTGDVAVEGDRIVVDAAITRPTVFLGAIGITATTVHGHGVATLISAG